MVSRPQANLGYNKWDNIRLDSRFRHSRCVVRAQGQPASGGVVSDL